MMASAINVFYQGSSGVRESFVIDKPADFYPLVAKKVTKEENGNKCTVTAGVDSQHYVVYNVGVRSGTMNVTSSYDTMPYSFQPTRRKDRYLALINRERNNYKYYHMIWNNNGSWTADYGRCGAGENDRFGKRSCTWDASMWDMKKCEKEAKGYKDITKYVLAEDDVELGDINAPASLKDTPSSDLYNLLLSYAHDVVKQEVHVPVNRTLLNRSRELIDELRMEAKAKDIEAFNHTLEDLLLIMQREIAYGDGQGVERTLAHDDSDFGRIIQREEDLCGAMEGLLSGDKKGGADRDFSDYDIEVYDANPEQLEFVKKHLGPDLSKRVKRVFRVISSAQKKAFDSYVRKNHISRVRCLWHGSKSENWLSIVLNGLKLNPDAEITGKMFGYGIYFALSAAKSWGYTSYHGSRWAGGSDDMGIMGLYATAYGHPYDINSWSPTDYRKAVKDGPYDCVHAHANSGFLYNDEIIYYDEPAVQLEYIVLFA